MWKWFTRTEIESSVLGLLSRYFSDETKNTWFTQRNIICLFRLHAFDFKDLKEGLRCPIEVSPNVTFYQTKSDEFLQIFKEFVENNTTYKLESEVRHTLRRIIHIRWEERCVINNSSLYFRFYQESEICIGCMSAEANVKLRKNCTDDHAVNETDDGAPLPSCVSCLCRPLWCIDCMGKW
jgi:hypothetical protein